MDGTYTLEACTISKGCHILIGDTPCQVSKVKYTEGERDEYGCIFDANDIFSWEKHTLECRATDLITCPYVCDHFYRIVWITKEGKVMLHKRKDPLYLPTTLLEPRQREGDVTPTIGFVARNQKKLQDGKQLLLNVKSAMGKEHICGITELSR